MMNNSSINIVNQSYHKIQGYKTVFYDDFEKLDKNVWTFHSQEEPAFGGHYNSRFVTNEDNVYIDEGCLVLDCSKTAGNNDGTYKKSNGENALVEYLAPYISTCDKFAISEGRISAKIKVSKGVEDGMFPFCFWTFGQNNSWAYAHEMDVMEGVVGMSSEDKVARDGTLIPAGSHSSVFVTHLFVRTIDGNSNGHDNYYKINWALYKDKRYDSSVSYLNRYDPTDWHVYSVEWNQDSITYYVDDVPVMNYTAEGVGAINADGDIGFYYPQDIRFNIKAGENTTDQHGYIFIDWVKAEALDDVPCLSISHEDIVLTKGSSLYINPTFNKGCTNKAFSVNIEDDGVLVYEKYLNDGSQMVAHKIIGRSIGETIVTLCAANGKVENTFKVRVN